MKLINEFLKLFFLVRLFTCSAWDADQLIGAGGIRANVGRLRNSQLIVLFFRDSTDK